MRVHPSQSRPFLILEATVHRSRVPSHLHLSTTRPPQLSPLLLGLLFLSDNFIYEYWSGGLFLKKTPSQKPSIAYSSLSRHGGGPVMFPPSTLECQLVYHCSVLFESTLLRFHGAAPCPMGKTISQQTCGFSLNWGLERLISRSHGCQLVSCKCSHGLSRILKENICLGQNKETRVTRQRRLNWNNETERKTGWMSDRTQKEIDS